jgi:hypothetical protein
MNQVVSSNFGCLNHRLFVAMADQKYNMNRNKKDCFLGLKL